MANTISKPGSPSPKSSLSFSLARRLVDGALRRVDAARLVQENISLEKGRLHIGRQRFELDAFDRLHVLGAGKAALFLYQGLRRLLGSGIDGGLIVGCLGQRLADTGQRGADPGVCFMTGSHPLPDRSSQAAGQAMIDYVRGRVGRQDLVIFLLTGGASALLAVPAPGIELEDKILITRELLRSGAAINELNCVRQAMSAVKGGRLGRMIHPARLITLILSDVGAASLATVGSGPTLPPDCPPGELGRILKKYRFIENMNPRVKKFFRSERTRSHFDLYPQAPSRHSHFLIGDNRLALEEIRSLAGESFAAVHILTANDSGDARWAARSYAALIRRIISGRHSWRPPVLLLAGGELTVTVSGSGCGGRNQEFMLALLTELADIHHPFLALSIGSDGIDGNTPAAGAWINQGSAARAQRLGLATERFLKNNDSHGFFKKMNQLIVTGPTRTNVMDLRLFFIGCSA